MFEKTFDQQGDFAALYAASNWLRANGYSCGSWQRGSPCGIMRGLEWSISKWRGMNARERDALHGQMSGDGRNGPITIRIKDEYAPQQSDA